MRDIQRNKTTEFLYKTPKCYQRLRMNRNDIKKQIEQKKREKVRCFFLNLQEKIRPNKVALSNWSNEMLAKQWASYSKL